LKGVHKFGHDTENAPGVFVDEVIGVVHRRDFKLKIKKEKLKMRPENRMV
jgi:hypothetical protein